MLLSKSDSLVINNKVNKERGIFKPNMDIKGGINWWEFKKVYDNIVKIDI